MSDIKTKSQDVCQKESKNKELLMVPTNVKSLRTLHLSHKRMGSTGTTGDESNTTDDDDDGDIDETDFGLPEHKQSNFFTNDFHNYSGISTITDKIDNAAFRRNNSDVSVYSGLEKCCDESASLNENNEENVGAGECKYDTIDWDGASSFEDMDNFTFMELKKSLREAQRQLKARKDEIHTLARLKQEVESELEDLTASLFQEAHSMVREANEKRAAAEKALKENEMKVEVLMAEVAALKTLVITSTPSRPNPHLHPQIDKNKDEGVVIFSKKHQRSPSHSHSRNGDSPPSPTESSCSESECKTQSDIELDPILHEEFLSWKANPVFDKTSSFINRIYKEDINLCLSFANSDLSQKVTEAVEKGMILIEAFGDKSKSLAGNCALLEVPKACSYRMNLGDNSDNWYNISQICRNRITAVCDFFNYLKYIERGLVKCSEDDMYCEVIRLRKNMALGRLGFHSN